MTSNYDGVFSLANLPRKSGYMYKKGGTVKGSGGRRNWKKRWFIIKPTEYRGKEAYELQYFDAPNGSLKGTVGLFDVEVYCETKSTHKRVKYEFQLLLQNGGIFQLSCDTEEEREEWITSFNIIISYLRKVVLSSGYSISGYDPTYEDEESVYQLGEEIGRKCRAFGPGLVGAEAGHKTHFLIQVNDIDGEPAQDGGMPITASISDATHLFHIRMVDNQDGTYSGYYAIGCPGEYDLHIRLNDEHHVEGSPYQIEILPTRTAAEHCIAVGENIFNCYPGQSSSFVIYAKDIYGNSKQKGGDPFEVSIVGPASLQSLEDNGDGSYTCCFEAKSPTDLSYFAPSSLLMSVTLYGKHISGSPFHPTILSQPPTSLAPATSPSDEDSVVDIEVKPVENTLRRMSLKQVRSSSADTKDEMKKETIVEESKANTVPTASKQDTRQSTLQPQSNPAPVNLRLSEQRRNSILNKEISKIEESTGAPLSRLERARQRALMARKFADSSVVQQYIEPPAESNPSSSGTRRASVMRTDIDPITGLPLNSSNTKIRAFQYSQEVTGDQSSPSKSNSWSMPGSELDKLLNPQPTVSVARETSTRRASVQRIDVDPITGLPIKPSKSATTLNSSLGSVSQGNTRKLADSASVTPATPPIDDTYRGQFTKSEVDAITSSLSSGLPGSIPVGVGDEEKVMWEFTEQALLSPEVAPLLVASIGPLKNTFDLMAVVVEGTHILKLTNSNNSGGLFKLLEEFDVIPTYVGMREVKKAFSLILATQRNAKTLSSMAGGGTGVDFVHFVKLLVMLAVYGLSKSTAFAALYKTPVSKVDVMLRKWGLADRNRIEVVKSDLARGR